MSHYDSQYESVFEQECSTWKKEKKECDALLKEILPKVKDDPFLNFKLTEMLLIQRNTKQQIHFLKQYKDQLEQEK